jgi:ATP-binding cassette subfamily C protein
MRIRRNSMSLRSVGELLPKSVRRSIYALAAARVAANLLDILGLAGIALLATSFGGFAAGEGSSAPLEMPLLGQITLGETAAVLIALGIAGIFILKSAFSIWLNLKTALFVASIEADLSQKLAEDYFSGGSEGESGFSDSLSEFQNVSMLSTQALSLFLNARIAAISEVSLLVAMTGVFLLINPIASVAMFLYLGLVMWALGRVVTKKIRKNGVNQLIGSEAALSSSRDLFGVRREVRASGVLQPWIARFAKHRAISASSSGIISALNSLPRYVIETSLVLGIFAFLSGVVVFSDLGSQAVTIGVFMVGGLRLVASLLPLQSAINSMIDGSSRGQLALDRLVAIATRQTVDHPQSNFRRNGEALGLVLRRVSFGFGTNQTVVHEISLSVEPGQKVALVGPSGAGKTTIFELATGFVLPRSGEIVVGGVAPRLLLGQGNGAIGIVPQRPHLVLGTLAENVSLSKLELADESQVVTSLQLAGLSHLSTPELLQMRVHPDSGQLSGGEIQRLGLARALYRNPGILFLDEATSALDAETESGINRVLDGLRGRMTIVLIAHRLSTVKNADKIIYLDGGKVIAEGTFAELQKMVPDFRNAVKLMGLEG